MSGSLALLDLLIRIGKGDSIILLGILWGRRAQLPVALRPLHWYLLLDVIVYVTGVYGSRVYRNNIPGFHLSTLFDVTCITLIFLRLGRKNNNLIKIGYLTFIITAILSAVWVDGFTTNINTLSRFYGNMFLVFIALYQVIQMASDVPTIRPLQNPVVLLCSMVIIYYSCSTFVIISQDLPRYAWFKNVYAFGPNFTTLTLLPYPFLRLIQAGILVRILTLFPAGVRPRQALPRWLRFRVGWRPPTEPPQYRVLPARLVG